MNTFPLRFALLGHPVAHSASPAMHTAALQAMGLPHVYEALDCANRAAFERAVGLLRRGYFAGLNVTSPYKADAVVLATTVSPEVRQMEAANTLRLKGGVVEALNTDVPAMLEQLQAAQPRQGIALIVGSGGAARAALAACLQLGVRVIGVTSRSWRDTETAYESPVAEYFRQQRALVFPWPGGESASEERSHGSRALQLQWREFAAMADLVVQATTAGRPGEDGHEVAALLPWDKVPPHAVAYELNYGPTPTPFVQAATRRGLRVLDGLELLARQGARSLALWVQRPVPYEVMLNAARSHLNIAP